MDERLFGLLAARLASEPVVVASVIATRGATPRKRGSRMLIMAEASEGSIGGGMAEQCVIEAGRRLLESTADCVSLEIELDGRAGSAGICGGQMRIALRRWTDDKDRIRAAEIAAALAAGTRVALDAEDLGSPMAADLAVPDVRLLIVGAGHCGAALCELAGPLDFERHVFDARPECLRSNAFDGAQRHADGGEGMRNMLGSGRDVQAVLLNRDFHADVAALRVLCERPPRFLGMLGSRRRIGEVVAALPAHADALEQLVAPVGIDIDAETPHEIAISILAQLIRERRRY